MEQTAVDEWTSAPGPVYYGLTSSYLAVVGLIGLSLNSLYGVIFLKEKSIRTPMGYLFLNLCISDLIISLTSLVKFVHTVLRTRLEEGGTICNLFGFFTFLGGEGALYTLTAISIYRCLVVTRISDPNVFTNRKVCISILCIWTQALGFAVGPLFGLNRFVPENPGTWCSLQWTDRSTASLGYLGAIFTCSFFIPIAVMITSYTRIALKIKEISRNLGRSSHSHKAEKSLTKSCILMAACFTASWTPYAFMSLCSFAGFEKPISPYLLVIPPLMCKASVCFDPFIYLLTVPKVTQLIHKYQGELRAWVNPPPPGEDILQMECGKEIKEDDSCVKTPDSDNMTT